MIRTAVELGWKSIPGHRHRVEGRENEDAVLTSLEHPYFDALMIVADGMGGHPEPRQAAQTAVAAARDYLHYPAHLEAFAQGSDDVVALLSRAVAHANSQVRRLAARVAPGAAGDKPPGCTLTITAVANGRIAVALVGDGSVFLFRDHRLRSLAGGEARRVGSRPEEFLGRADQVPVETASQEARPGDRLLLCTDGLTRYFGAGETFSTANGLERLQQIVARPTADPQALASQLTADGRGEQYDDDTTVVVAAIGAAREAPEPLLRHESAGRENGAGARGEGTDRPAPQRAPVSRGGIVPLLIVAAAAAAAGFFGGRATRTAGGHPPAPFQPFSAPAVSLPHLPAGGVLLVNRDTGRFFALRTRPAAAPVAEEPLSLSELRYVPGKGLRDTGSVYRLDAARGLLTTPGGRVYAVTLDGAAGVLQFQQAGTLRVQTQPAGLPVFIDGLSAGLTPLSVTVRAGSQQVQVLSAHGRSVFYHEPVTVAPRSTTTVSLTAPEPAPEGRP